MSEYNRAASRRSHLKHRDKYAKWNKEYLQKKRRRLMMILGGAVCVKCGFQDVRALQFDHLAGGGAKDEKEKGGNIQTLDYYLKHPEVARGRLQVLCVNCNWIKKYAENEHADNTKYRADDLAGWL